MKHFLFVITILLYSAAAFAQGSAGQSNYPISGIYAAGAPSGTCPGQNIVYINSSNGNLYTCPVPGGSWTLQSGGGSGGGSLVTSGLLAEYKIQEGTGTTLDDTSGNGNNATFCASHPTWIVGSNLSTGTGTQYTTSPNSGGLSFNGSSNCVNLPSALNAAKSFLFVINFQPALGSASNYMLLVGNGGNTASSGFGFASASDGSTSSYIETIQTSFTRETEARAGIFGTAALGFNLDTVDHIFVNGQEVYWYSAQGTTQGLQTAGNFQLGGASPAGTGNFYSGSVYYMAAWNRVLTLAEEGQMYSYVAAQMAGRGVAFQLESTNPTNTFLADGDSITLGGSSPPYTEELTLNGTWTVQNIGEGGAWISFPTSPAASLLLDTLTAPQYCSNQAQSVVVVWAGTNDMAGSASSQAVVGAYQGYAQRMHNAGCKVVAVPMLSRNGQDANKDSLDTLMRAQWPTFADAFADVAAAPLLGADGAYSNTNIFISAGVHPTAAANQYITAPIISRAVNRLYGNHSFSSANVYSSATASGQTITAASESGNVVTFTFASNAIAAGTHDVSITGVTPSGYNQPCNVQTSTSTQITCFNSNTGLGAGTVFGTAQVPSQVDADQYIVLNYGSGNFLLQSCVGYTGQDIFLKNINATSSTVVPNNTETIDGSSSATVATGATLQLESVLVSASAAGCNWKRMQNN